MTDSRPLLEVEEHPPPPPSAAWPTQVRRPLAALPQRRRVQWRKLLTRRRPPAARGSLPHPCLAQQYRRLLVRLYIPNLSDVVDDLDATDQQVSLTIQINWVLLGLATPVVGHLSDM